MTALDIILREQRGRKPTFERDFAGVKTLNHGTGPAITFTRASDATYFDANGVLQTVAANVPRFDHDPATGASRGLLIEEARTNSIRNSQAGGSTSGVIGSGGAMPTHWTAVSFGFGDVEVVGSGTDGGFSYVDVRFYGTNSSGNTGIMGYYPEFIAAAPNQTWTGSHYVKLQAGSTSGVDSFTTNLQGRKADQSSSGDTTAVALTPTASFQRVSATCALNGVDAALVSTDIVLYVLDGQSIDLTLRIAAPQLEQGAFATSYIPTTTAAVTRAADSAIVTPISSFYNAAEGTLFAELSRYSTAGSGSIFVADNETIGNRVGLFGTVAQVAISDAYTSVDTFSLVAGTVYRGILGYRANDHAATLNGAAVETNTAVGLPTAATHIRLGAEAFAGGELSGHIRRIAYYPKRLSNALLQSLTT